MCDVIKRAKDAIIDLPPSPQNKSHTNFPIKGLCTARCGQDGDHQPYSDGAYRDLMKCARRYITSRGGNRGGGE